MVYGAKLHSLGTITARLAVLQLQGLPQGENRPTVANGHQHLVITVFICKRAICLHKNCHNPTRFSLVVPPPKKKKHIEI